MHAEITFDRTILDSLSKENIKNLRKVAKYMPTIPKKDFAMDSYRSSTDEVPDSCMSHNCNTIGCILGHATILFPFNQIPKYLSGNINFNELSGIFFGINNWKKEWSFLFGPEWYNSDNTPEGASRRILYFLENGLPSNWDEQMMGLGPISY